MGIRSIPALFLIACFIVGCSEPAKKKTITRSFYFWKSRFKLSATESQSLADLGVNRLYVKFFDVVWSEKQKTSIPVAKLAVDSSALTFFNNKDHQLVPVIFITNESIARTPEDEIDGLAERIYKLYSVLNVTNGLQTAWTPEVQFDCDWTEMTNTKYFKLLDHLQTILLPKNKKVSATIRLYQCKYKEKTGVPPVSKGLLMCYNMGNLKDPGNDGNSIIEPNELKKYISNLDDYPLSLDVALPLFEWKVLIRQNSFAGLMQELPDSSLNNELIAKVKGNGFEIQMDTVLHEYPLKKGDFVRVEKSTVKDIMEATKAIGTKLKSEKIAVSLYHLDSLVLSKYKTNELENIYNSLR